jgi:hypothetical protein
MNPLEEFQIRFPNVPTGDDDRCSCDGCRVAYIRDILAGESAGMCDCGCDDLIG